MKKTKWYIFCFMFFLLSVCGAVFSKVFYSYFSFDRIFCYFCGYFAAVFYREYKEITYKRLVCVLTATTVLLNCLRIYFKYIVHFRFQGFPMFEEYAHALLGISIVLFSLLFIKIEKKKMIFELSDKYSFYIYLVHQLFILSPFTLLSATPYKVINWFLTIIAIVVSAKLLELISRIVTSYLNITISHIKEKVVL